jgi:purine-binding chemotaxis protein CheW
VKEVENPGRELLVLQLGKARFGAWVDEVLEIVRTPPISRLPLSHPEVLGVTSVRGDVLPVLDLGVRLLGVPATLPGRLVVVRHHDSGTIVGLLVDGAQSLLDVREEELRKPPTAAADRLPAELVTGVVSRDEGVVTVLHMGRAAAPPVPAKDER